MHEIMGKLLKIFKERFNMDLFDDWSEIQDEHLLGRKLDLQAGDLLYLFFDIEKEFGITISEEYITSGKFSSLRNIVQMILCGLEAKNTSVDGAKVS